MGGLVDGNLVRDQRLQRQQYESYDQRRCQHLPQRRTMRNHLREVGGSVGKRGYHYMVNEI